jgi:hypothetical protein
VTGQGVAAQCQTPAWEGLAVLCLNRCEEVDDAALVALAASPASAALRILELEGTAIGAAGARALVASPYLTGLTRLRVRGTRAAKGATLKALRARWPPRRHRVGSASAQLDGASHPGATLRNA